MIIWIRSAAVAQGKMGEAIGFVKKTSAHVQQKHNIAITVSRPIAGNPTRIFWSSQHDDLQAYERDHRTINSDMEFVKMMGEGAQLFIGGTTHDEILQTI